MFSRPYQRYLRRGYSKKNENGAGINLVERNAVRYVPEHLYGLAVA